MFFVFFFLNIVARFIRRMNFDRKIVIKDVR